MTGRAVDLRGGANALRDSTTGEMLLLSGPIISARDAAQERLSLIVAAGGEPPFELSGRVLFYMSPAPGRDGLAVSSAGPTTSSRMDRYSGSSLPSGRVRDPRKPSGSAQSTPRPIWPQ